MMNSFEWQYLLSHILGIPDVTKEAVNSIPNIPQECYLNLRLDYYRTSDINSPVYNTNNAKITNIPKASKNINAKM